MGQREGKEGGWRKERKGASDKGGERGKEGREGGKEGRKEGGHEGRKARRKGGREGGKKGGGGEEGRSPSQMLVSVACHCSLPSIPLTWGFKYGEEGTLEGELSL